MNKRALQILTVLKCLALVAIIALCIIAPKQALNYSQTSRRHVNPDWDGNKKYKELQARAAKEIPTWISVQERKKLLAEQKALQAK